MEEFPSYFIQIHIEIRYTEPQLDSREEDSRANKKNKEFTSTKSLSQPGLIGATSSWCTISPPSTSRALQLSTKQTTAEAYRDAQLLESIAGSRRRRSRTKDET